MRKAGRRDEGHTFGWRNEKHHTSNYWISEREMEDDRSGDDMEKVYTDRHSIVDKGTEQDYSELTDGEMEPAHLWERHTEEVVELNLKARLPSRRTEIQQDKIECRLAEGSSTDLGQRRIAIPDEKDADKRDLDGRWLPVNTRCGLARGRGRRGVMDQEQKWTKGGQRQRPSEEQQWTEGGQRQRPSEEQQWTDGEQRQRPSEEQQWTKGGQRQRPSQEQQWTQGEQRQRPSEEQQLTEGGQRQRVGRQQRSYGLYSFPRFGDGERWRHRWDAQDWTRQRESDQHRSSVERELLKLTSQDRRRAEQEDLEFKMIIPLIQTDTLPGRQPTIDEGSLQSSP